MGGPTPGPWASATAASSWPCWAGCPAPAAAARQQRRCCPASSSRASCTTTPAGALQLLWELAVSVAWSSELALQWATHHCRACKSPALSPLRVREAYQRACNQTAAGLVTVTVHKGFPSPGQQWQTTAVAT